MASRHIQDKPQTPHPGLHNLAPFYLWLYPTHSPPVQTYFIFLSQTRQAHSHLGDSVLDFLSAWNAPSLRFSSLTSHHSGLSAQVSPLQRGLPLFVSPQEPVICTSYSVLFTAVTLVP